MQDKSEWWGFVRGETTDLDEMLQLYEALGGSPVCGQAYKLKGIKGKISLFSCLS